MRTAAELDVEAIEKLAGKAMDVALKRLGIHLGERRYEDLHEYLVDLGFRMSVAYDPSVGQAFSTYFYRRARRRSSSLTRAGRPLRRGDRSSSAKT